MNTKLITQKVIAAGALASMMLSATPAFAAVGANITATADTNIGNVVPVSAKVDVKVDARVAKAQDRGNQELDRRTAALTDLNTKVQAMERVQADAKASISNTIVAQISALTALKAKIDADTDIATLKTDIKSITESYRIFALVMPQVRIIVAGDRVTTSVVTMTTLGAKLKTRIDAAKAAGKDTSALEAKFADMGSKVGDAQVQAQGGAAAVAALSPDNGDKTVMDSNHKVIVDSHAKIKASITDLQAARADAVAIADGLKKLSVSASASATASTSAQ